MLYCDVSMTPHWDYDTEKAIILSCNLIEEEDIYLTKAVDSDDTKTM